MTRASAPTWCSSRPTGRQRRASQAQCHGSGSSRVRREQLVDDCDRRAGVASREDVKRGFHEGADDHAGEGVWGDRHDVAPCDRVRAEKIERRFQDLANP